MATFKPSPKKLDDFLWIFENCQISNIAEKIVRFSWTRCANGKVFKPRRTNRPIFWDEVRELPSFKPSRKISPDFFTRFASGHDLKLVQKISLFLLSPSF